MTIKSRVGAIVTITSLMLTAVTVNTKAYAAVTAGDFTGTANPTSSLSNDQFLVLSTAALHFKKADERNDFTPGIGWEYSPSSAFGFHLGTLSDSFGYQAKYLGINYATPNFAVLGGRTRFILGVTMLNKQYHPDSEPETKILPLPAVEFRFARRATLNISGSPQVDYAGQQNNAVLFFQFKLNLI